MKKTLLDKRRLIPKNYQLSYLFVREQAILFMPNEERENLLLMRGDWKDEDEERSLICFAAADKLKQESALSKIWKEA